MAEQNKTVSRLLWIARILIIVAVVWGIRRAIINAQAEFAAEEFNWQGIRWWWLVIGGLVYCLGLLPMAFFWRRILLTLGQDVRFLPLLRAYYIGHLGKYVPGKAMVVVLRTGLLQEVGLNTAVVAVSVVIETLTMMAVGACLAAVALLIRFRGEQKLQLLAIGMMLATVIPTLPPVLKAAVRTLRRTNEETTAALQRYSWRAVGHGWLLCSIGWVSLAASLWAVLKSIPVADPLPGAITTATTSLAAVTLAMVAGFLSLLPGGVGVREWVLNELLVTQFGSIVALFSAVLLRMVWLVTELIVSAILELGDRVSAGQR